MPKKEQKFEQALIRLSEIVDNIEDGETTLDGAIKLYKEGLKLAENCGDILGRYETEVLQLQKDAEGVFTLAPFSGGMQTNA